MSTFKIIRDTREKENKGWWFDDRKHFAGTVKQKLATGDYSIQGYEYLFTIERKGHVGEFANNLVSERFTKELERLRNFKFAFLLLEFEMDHLYKFPNIPGIPKYKRKHIKLRGPFLLKKAMTIVFDYSNVQMIFCGEKRGKEVATSILKRMIETIEREKIPPATNYS